MRKKIKRTVISVLGVFFVLMGILGLVMPFLQGFFFLAIGLILISIYSPTLRGWIKTQARPYPKFYATVEKVEAWIMKNIGH